VSVDKAGAEARSPVSQVPYLYAGDSPATATDPTGRFLEASIAISISTFSRTLRRTGSEAAEGGVRVFCESIDISGPGRGFWDSVALGVTRPFYAPQHCFVVVEGNEPDARPSDYPGGLKPPFKFSLEIHGPIDAVTGRATPEKKEGGMVTPRRGVEVPTSPWSYAASVAQVYGVRGRLVREACALLRYESLIQNLPRYNWAGPNSNTFAYQIASGCGLSVFMPSEAVGWDY